MGKRLTIWIDDLIFEAIEELHNEGMSKSEIVNTLLLEAISTTDIIEELRQEIIHKKHVEKRKRVMRIAGFTSAMINTLQRAEKRGLDEDGLKQLIKDFRDEAEELGIVDKWREGLRILYNLRRNEAISTTYIEDELSKVMEEDLYGME